MIRIVRPDEVPGSLTKWGGKQTQLDCIAFDASPADYNAGAKFPAKSYYRSTKVKNRLVEIHHCKCCYCEKKFPSGILQVEHIRPKGGVRQTLDQTTDEWPGYYWLAYEWTNLLLACQICNGTTNKWTFFPLANPTKRARSHHDDVTKERALFIDPSKQNPRRHIRFENELPKGRTPTGRMTIKGIGLDSPQLMGNRRDKIADVKVRLDYIEAAAQHPDDAEMQAKATEFRQYVRSARQPGAEFSSMMIDYLYSLKARKAAST